MVKKLLKIIVSNWIGLLFVGIGVGVCLLADLAPIVFNIFPSEFSSGTIVTSYNYQGLPATGPTNVYIYKFIDHYGVERMDKSWAPTLGSKPGLFWKVFPIMEGGTKVEVEYLKINPNYSRINGMRKSNISFDLVLFASFLCLVAMLATSKRLKGSKLFYK